MTEMPDATGAPATDGGRPTMRLPNRELVRISLYWLGLSSIFAGLSYIIASRLLAFSLFGLLSYVEPVLLLGVALLLGESICPGEWLTYIPIWLAVLVLVFEGFKHLVRHLRP